jgi:hypothetical protein
MINTSTNKKVIVSLTFLLSIPFFSLGQSTLEALRNLPIPKYIMVYSERFIKEDQAGYYFIIDEGRKDIKNTLDSVRRNMIISDSGFYLKDRKGLTVSFESPLGFLNHMSLHGWDLICDYSSGTALNNSRDNKELHVFLIRKRIK